MKINMWYPVGPNYDQSWMDLMHITAELACDICNHVWLGQYPMAAYDAAGLCRLECPQCGYMNHAPDFGCLDDDDDGADEQLAGC